MVCTTLLSCDCSRNAEPSPSPGLSNAEKHYTPAKSTHPRPAGQREDTAGEDPARFSPKAGGSVNLDPYCKPEKQQGKGVTNDLFWLGVSNVREYEALGNALRSYPGFLGIVPEQERRRLVVVMEPEFSNWRLLQDRIASAGQFVVPVELRPGCHSRPQRDQALKVLKELQRDANVGRAIHAWNVDPSNGGYRVYVLPGRTDAAKAVREHLGSLANVWFTREFGLH